MRDTGIPKLLTWRWAPCAALVLGSLSFVGFVTLAVPEQIGSVVDSAGRPMRLGNQLSRTRGPTEAMSELASDGSGSETDAPAAPPAPATRVATHAANTFPRRGFTPPLDRPEPPAPPPPPPAAPVLAVPPPAPAPAEAPAQAAPAPAPPEQVAAQPEQPPPGNGPAPSTTTPQ